LFMVIPVNRTDTMPLRVRPSAEQTEAKGRRRARGEKVKETGLG
jgi:hypothetical protein